MNEPVYLAAHHQSAFGSLMAVTLREIVRNAVAGVSADAKCGQAILDVGVVGTTCTC
jgi:hypothetical protein